MEQQITFTIESKKEQIDALTEEQLLEYKQKQDSVEIIVLKGNSYSKIFFSQFQELIKNSKNLSKVNANDIFVGRGKDEIPQSLSLFGSSLIGLNIVSIDLSNNAVNPYGAEAMKPFLKQAHTLKRLFLNNCGLGITGATHISEGLSEGGVGLEILAMARNRAECEGANKVSDALVKLKALKELHIYQNGIKQIGMIQLLTSLGKNCDKLETLDVRDNFIHKDTTKYLGELIQKSKQLVCLNISDCNIEQEQNDLIIESLSHLEQIKKLSYNYAEINDQQGQQLLAIVKKSINSIEKLELKGNELKQATKVQFKELFKENIKVLGAFDSDDEDENEVDEMSRMFSQLVI